MMVGRVPVQLPKVTVGMEEGAVEGGADVGVVAATAVVDDVVEALPPEGAAVVLVVAGCGDGGLAVEDPHADNSAAPEKPTQAMTTRRGLRSLTLMVTGTL